MLFESFLKIESVNLFASHPFAIHSSTMFLDSPVVVPRVGLVVSTILTLVTTTVLGICLSKNTDPHPLLNCKLTHHSAPCGIDSLEGDHASGQLA